MLITDNQIVLKQALIGNYKFIINAKCLNLYTFAINEISLPIYTAKSLAINKVNIYYYNICKQSLTNV
jgi:hypothetical protein